MSAPTPRKRTSKSARKAPPKPRWKVYLPARVAEVYEVAADDYYAALAKARSLRDDGFKSLGMVPYGEKAASAIRVEKEAPHA